MTKQRLLMRRIHPTTPDSVIPMHEENRLLREMHARQLLIIRLLERIMSSQDNINADVAAINAAIADLATQNTNIQTDMAAIQTEIANLKAQGVDTTALDAAAGNLAASTGALDTTVQGLGAIAPAPAPPATGGTTTPPATGTGS